MAGGSSPDKFFIFAEEVAIPHQIVSSPSTPDHVLVEDCSDDDDYDADEVDYSASGGSSKFFCSPVPPSTGTILPDTPPSVLRASPLCSSGQPAIPVATSTVTGPSPVPAPQHHTSGPAVGNHNLPPVISPPAEVSPSGTSHSPAPIGQWRDLFASNRSTITGPKLPFLPSSCDDLPCDLSPDDFDITYDIWQLCIVGYVAGKSPGFKALSNIISSSWKCEASLSIHESGWLVYKFKTVDDKLAVLANGPYLIYGRPLIIKAMPEYFDFGADEMSCVPVWVKFPGLPFKCWSRRCLSRIANKLGTPIQSDQLTCNMARVSYARVLVELNLLADLKSSIVINLPNGSTLTQPVIYETLPRFCKLCKVLGHNTGTCTSTSTSSPTPVVARPLGKQRHPSSVTTKGRSVFDRLGPVAEPRLGKANGQLGEFSHSYDPMTTEVAVASDEWEIVKSKKARKSSSIPASATHAADQVATTLPRGTTPAISSSGGICTPVCNLPLLNKGKEPVGAVPCRKESTVVPVGITTTSGRRRSSSRASGSGRVPPPPPPM